MVAPCMPPVKEVIYINLDAAVDRRGRMERMLGLATANGTSGEGVPWRRWRAVDGSVPLRPSQEIALRVDPGGASGSVRDEPERQRPDGVQAGFCHGEGMSGEGVPWRRWRAADGSVPLRLLQEIALCVDPGGTWGSVSDEPGWQRTAWCFLSHLDVLRDLQRKGGDGVYLILEDDVLLEPGWCGHLRQQLRDVPSDWDLVLAGWWNACRDVDLCSPSCYMARGPTTQVLNERRLYFYAGQHGYLVRPGPHLDRLVDFLTAQPIRHIDEMRCYGSKVGPRTYALVHRVVSEDFASSRASTRASQNTVSLYVSWLPLSWSAQQLRAAAGQFGQVHEACVRNPPDAAFTAKYGFISVSAGDAEVVLRGLAGLRPGGGMPLLCRRQASAAPGARSPAAPPMPPVVVPLAPRRPGSRGPMPGSMWRIGNAGRGRRTGSKNKEDRIPGIMACAGNAGKGRPLGSKNKQRTLRLGSVGRG